MRKFLGRTFVATLALTGCIDQGEVDTSSTEQMLKTGASLPSGVKIRNESGFGATVTSDGDPVDFTNPFFQDLGKNGRRCVSCHLPTAGWTVTPEQMQAIFHATNGGVIDDGFGLGAAFRLNDGANSPLADVSTYQKRRQAYSMLLTRGLIRVGIGIPANAEFELAAVDDPYGFASAAELSLFRRPLPTANLKFLSTVMWDGRETVPGATIHFDLVQQSNDATTGHAEGNPISNDTREAIVAEEMRLAFAQEHDDAAKTLHAAGANGGAEPIHDQTFYIGINDNFGDSQTNAPFTPLVFDLYNAWTNVSGGGTNAARRAVARGQALFNTRTITLSGVSGLNNESIAGHAPLPASFPGTCTTCHDAPNAGNHSIVAPLNIGLTDASRRTPDMPLYTLRCNALGAANGACTLGQTVQTTDPGRALINGKWKFIGRFKGPILRGLAARAPYFHNGLARDLGEVVDFYNTRFGMNLTAHEKSDLVAFLRTL